MIVGLQHVDRLGSRPVRAGDAAFEREHADRFCIRVRHAGQLQHGRDVVAVRGSDLLHARRRVEVVIPVGHPEAALQEIRRVARRIVEVLRDPQAEDVIGVKVRVVERIDVRADALPEPRRERAPVHDRRDRLQRIGERGDPARLDCRLVQIAGVVVAKLALIGSGGRVPCHRTGEQIARALQGLLGEDRPHAVAAAVGRNLCGLQPGPVGEVEEVVARLSGFVHPREVDVVRGGRRGRLRIGLVAGRFGVPAAARHERKRERRDEEGRGLETCHERDDTLWTRLVLGSARALNGDGAIVSCGTIRFPRHVPTARRPLRP